MNGRRDGESSDRAWLDHVRPQAWPPPTPASIYDLVVVGGGTAGLVCAMGAAGLGARVALVERHRLGGDCLNTGCVPSKAIIRSARVIGELKRAARLGIEVAGARVDVAFVLERMRARRAALAPHDSAARLHAAGVHVFFEEARFTGSSTLQAGGVTLRFRRAVIATGTRPRVPAVPGLETVPFLTNETIFDLSSLPRRLVVVGGGPAGCELAQAFARFGSAVTLLEGSPHLLPRESPRAAAIVEAALARDGVDVRTRVQVEHVRTSNGVVEVRASRSAEHRDGAGPIECAADALLVAVGRVPNVERLDLGAAGIRAGADGIIVDDRLETTNRRVFASGDVCSPYRFTHAADAMSRIVVRNALFFGRARASRLVIPWATYTDPEVAHVGVTHDRATESGGRIDAITVDMDRVDRAVIDEETDGFITVYHERGRVRGVTIVAAHAAEMIAAPALALAHGVTMGELSGAIFPYPTYSEALRKAGDEYRRRALTPRARRWLSRYFEWTRR